VARPCSTRLSIRRSGMWSSSAKLSAAPPLSRHSASGWAAIWLEHALDRAGLRLQAAGADRIDGATWLQCEAAARQRQLRGAAGERLLHQLDAGQDQAAEEVTVGRQQIHRGRGAGHHHQAGSRVQRAGADQRRPAVGAELERIVVQVAHAAGGLPRAQPFDVCAAKCGGDPPGDGRARHIAAHDP
jgi:hypothetical protein